MQTPREITVARIIARLNVGGPAVQAVLMTEALRARGYRTLLLAGEVPPGEASLDYLAEAHGVIPVKISTLSRRVSLGKDLASFFRLSRILLREKPLVVHTHTAKAGTLGRLAALVSRTPIRVHTFHGHVFHGYFSPLVNRAVVAIERFLARHTDRIVAISESQKRELSEVYRIAPSEKIKVIPLGLDLAPFLRVEEGTNAVNTFAGLEPRVLVAGWIGRFAPVKAPGLFLDGARLVRRGGAAIRFVMIGDGELRSVCEQQIHNNQLDEVVSIAGWQQDMARMYAGFDLVVSTSVNEGTPVALLEAMASARPFVATDVGGVRDLMVGSGVESEGMEVFANGILIPRDAEALSRAVCYLGHRPDLRRSMGRVGREFVRDRFSHHRLADDLEALYLSLARSKGYLQPQPSTISDQGVFVSSEENTRT